MNEHFRRILLQHKSFLPCSKTAGSPITMQENVVIAIIAASLTLVVVGVGVVICFLFR
jgi:hypothetical protein